MSLSLAFLSPTPFPFLRSSLSNRHAVPNMTYTPIRPPSHDSPSHDSPTPSLAQRARLELRAGDRRAACELFTKHLESTPDDARAALQLAKLERGKRRQRVLERALGGGADTEENVWRALAVEVERSDGLEKAAKVYERAVGKCGDAVGLLSGWAGVVMGMGNVKEGRQLFERAVQVGKQQGFIYVGWAKREMEVGGGLNKAMEVMEKGIKNTKEGEDVLYREFGKIMVRARKWEGARKMFSKAAEKGDRRVWHAWGAMEERVGNLDRAVELYERGVIADSGWVGNWQAWGMLEMRRGEWDAARGLFERGCQVEEGTGCWVQWAGMERRRGEIELARELYGEARKRVGKGEGKGLWLMWGKMEEEDGNVEKARDVYAEGARREGERVGDRIKLLCAWGGMERKGGEMERARDLFEQALKLNTRDGKTMHALAGVEEKLGSMERARELLRWAVEVDGRDVMVVRALGRLEWVEFGNVDKAREVFKEGLKKGGRNNGLLRFWASMEERELGGNKELSVMLKEKANRWRR